MKKINTLKSLFATCGSNGNCPSELTRADLDAAIFYLLFKNTPLVKQNGENQAPVSDFFYALIPEPLVESVKKVTGFIDVNDYPAGCKPEPEEIGCIGNARLILNSEYKPIYGVVFTNDLKSKGQLVLACTI